MSKIKNSPEFQKMIDEQELASSFNYQEQEKERQEMFDLLAKQDAILTATNEYLDALTAFGKAQEKYNKVLQDNRASKDRLFDEERGESAADQLRDMFEGFNPNS